MSERWRRLHSEIIHDAGIFRLRRDAYEHDGQRTRPFYILESNAWINVVPVTPEGGIVLVRQYRHGIGEPTLEVPGGLVDDKDPTPAAAAVRELLEETGHAGKPPELLGVVSSNPAILTNRTHCFLVRDARPVGEPDPDPHEDVTVEVHPAARVREMVLKGEIHHSLSACALLLHFLRGHA
ncbi:MAG: NUDIX hydrolase [Planctomycetes bacterium]|nr:NUDIX hydrolase [Planctomycetota bacterium]